MFFLGIDQSLTSSGVCVLEEGADIPRYLTNIPTGKQRGGERLNTIFTEILYAVNRWKPEVAAMEGYSFDSVHRAFDLGEVGGIVRLVLHQSTVPVLTVAPTQVKKFAGKASADKEAMRRLVEVRWHQEIEQDDMCDAYVLAQVARAYCNPETVTVRAELEVVRGLKKVPQPQLISYKTRSINT